MVTVALLLLVAGAATPCAVGGAGGCPAGQYCAAEYDLRDASCPDAGTCRPLPSDDGLALSLPVPAGARVFCTQGILGANGHTHAACSADRRFALDLASSAFEAPHLVLASADGVASAWGDCRSTDLNHDPPDATCNLGLGNVVRLQHAGGLYTQYAHLSAILVIPGQRVKRGEPIGVEGNSGAAGSKHLHFSLHRGDGAKLEPAPSLPMRHLRVKDGRVLDSLDLRCGDATDDGGPAATSAYVSDNVPIARAPSIGFTPPARYVLEAAAGRIFEVETRPKAIEVLRKFPKEPLARYWLAVALELDGDRKGAVVIFTDLGESSKGPAWIRRWSWLRIADVYVAQGNAPRARKALERSREGAPLHDADFLRFADYVRRAVDWLERHP